MRIIVTGSDGFIGKHLVSYLIAAYPSADVITFGRDVNLEDPGVCSLAFENIPQADYVFHLADKSGSSDWSQANSGMQFFTNSSITINVLRSVSSSQRSARFVGVSSLWAYPSTVQIAREDSYWNGPLFEATQHYGFNKKLISVGLQACKQEYGLDGTMLVLCSAYGPGDKSDHIIPTLIRKMKAGADSIKLSSNGLELRDFAYVSDLAKAICLHRDYPGKLLNIGSGRHYTIRSVVDTLTRLLDYPGKIEYSESVTTGDRILDLALAREFSGWPDDYNLYDLEEGLLMTIKSLEEAK